MISILVTICILLALALAWSAWCWWWWRDVAKFWRYTMFRDEVRERVADGHVWHKRVERERARARRFLKRAKELRDRLETIRFHADFYRDISARCGESRNRLSIAHAAAIAEARKWKAKYEEAQEAIDDYRAWDDTIARLSQVPIKRKTTLQPNGVTLVEVSVDEEEMRARTQDLIKSFTKALTQEENPNV